MADLTNVFAGIASPNPFWLASAPPTDKAYNVHRAFEAGWGGVVWKTLGEAGPPIVNVSGPRYGALHASDRTLVGFNNIELITDRPLEVNLREIRQVKRDWPGRALVVSIMVPCDEDAWKRILPMVEDTGCDGIELNFGCPHGMSERGMGSAVGQVPEYVELVTRWCKTYSRLPVIVKLTPNITNILHPARAARRGGADAVSLINTITSIMGVDLDTFSPTPSIDGKASHGGYCGPAVKPIAMNMVAAIARDHECAGMGISGIGGISTWRDGAEFMTLGAGNVQVCTAAMVYGFKIVEDMIDGLNNWMDSKRHQSLSAFTGKAVPNFVSWEKLNLNYTVKARIDQSLCIKCGRCHIACQDTSHQAITREKRGVRHFEVIDDECVGCNLCVEVCPVEQCITLQPLAVGSIDPRTGQPVRGYGNWESHPNNPASHATEPVVAGGAK
jgi:dihydropyrimidine dehydrogenase (NAD+) subunit PreA